jgi:hypothetical protein
MNLRSPFRFSQKRFGIYLVWANANVSDRAGTICGYHEVGDRFCARSTNGDGRRELQSGTLPAARSIW